MQYGDYGDATTRSSREDSECDKGTGCVRGSSVWHGSVNRGHPTWGKGGNDPLTLVIVVHTIKGHPTARMHARHGVWKSIIGRMNEEGVWMTGVWRVWMENFRGMDFKKKGMDRYWSTQPCIHPVEKKWRNARTSARTETPCYRNCGSRRHVWDCYQSN